MACETFSILSLITLNNCQSSKDILRPKRVNSGACLRAQKVGDDQTEKLEVVERLELHGTEFQVGAQISARQGMKRP